MPKILAGYPAGKIGCRQIYIYSSLAQLVERSAVKHGFQSQKVSSSIRKLIDEKVAKSVELLTDNAEDNTELGINSECRDFTPPA